MKDFSIIVIAGSAGGLSALLHLAAHFPADLPAAILVALHVSPNSPGTQPALLNSRCALPAVEAQAGEKIEPGRIYIAPPDFHLLIEKEHTQLSHGPRENRQRPAADPLFRSAARAYGPRVIGVVLSGMMDDGTSGLLAIKARGGAALVQDPLEAAFPGMPQSAVDHVKVDAVLPLGELAKRLIALVHTASVPSAALPATDPTTELELLSTQMDESTLDRTEHPGTPSGFGCPECGGVMWQINDGPMLRYRCRVGHAMSSRVLLAAQSDAMEDALWTALRALEEKIALTNAMAARNSGSFRESLLEDGKDALQQADKIRKMLKLEEFQIRD